MEKRIHDLKVALKPMAEEARFYNEHQVGDDWMPDVSIADCLKALDLLNAPAPRTPDLTMTATEVKARAEAGMAPAVAAPAVPTLDQAASNPHELHCWSRKESLGPEDCTCYLSEE